jgi:hypothetical protein
MAMVYRKKSKKIVVEDKTLKIPVGLSRKLRDLFLAINSTSPAYEMDLILASENYTYDHVISALEELEKQGKLIHRGEIGREWYLTGVIRE